MLKETRGVSVIIVDMVTERAGSLHVELFDLLRVRLQSPGQSVQDLYATAYRTVPTPGGLHLETWAHSLSLGGALPCLPLWLQADLCLPLDLEATYHEACVSRRIAS